MDDASANEEQVLDFGQATVATPPPERQCFSPDESEQTRWNKLLTRGIGDYVLKGILGRGTFGTVYKAYDEALDREVAIKMLNNPLDATGMELFQQEARVIAALSKHPAVVQIYRFGDVDGCPYFVLEYIQSSAADLLQTHPNGLPPEVALRIARTAAEGLGHAHRQGVLHRDIKPANILLEEEGRTVKLVDFGIAHLQKLQGSSQGVIAGSPPFMSPEQVECRELDGRADIFSLGVTLYQLLCGKLPFAGRTTSELFQNIRNNIFRPLQDEMPGIPPDIAAVVAKATAHNRNERFIDADALAEALRDILEPRGSQPAPAEAAPPPPRRRRTTLVTAGLSAVAAVLVIVAVLVLGPFAKQDNRVLAEARQDLDEGDYQGAENLYRSVLEQHPADPFALYGQGFVHLLQGAPQDAAPLFETIPESSELRSEGLAAVAAETDPNKAKPVIEEARGHASKYAYPDVLLARIEALEQKQQAVIDRLSGLSTDKFYFGWQFAEALQLLGQAYYGLKQFEKAQAIFEQLKQFQSANGRPQQQVADAYIQIINQQLNATKRSEIREAAQRITKMLREGAVTPITDAWTSRPLTLCILPVEQPVTAFALDSGLGDLLPSTLGDSIGLNSHLSVVDRSLLQEVLAEQELSGLLSTKNGRLNLGNVLGARVLIAPKFRRLGGKERILLDAADTETTDDRPIQALEVDTNSNDIDALMTALTQRVEDMAKSEYPLQARLHQRENAAYINIGTQCGLEKSMVFDVLADPALPPLEGATATVTEGLGADSARVEIVGLALQDLPTEPGSAWYVKQRTAGT
ncbi:MAG: protein kinase [Candidatus Hydrogenedentes bacterium]|nr:protein kinase [Candidatus Hydrogenedentota bacterium]